jgi:hypothetical protein
MKPSERPVRRAVLKQGTLNEPYDDGKIARKYRYVITSLISAISISIDIMLRKHNYQPTISIISPR